MLAGSAITRIALLLDQCPHSIDVRAPIVERDQSGDARVLCQACVRTCVCRTGMLEGLGQPQGSHVFWFLLCRAHLASFQPGLRPALRLKVFRSCYFTASFLSCLCLSRAVRPPPVSFDSVFLEMDDLFGLFDADDELLPPSWLLSSVAAHDAPCPPMDGMPLGSLPSLPPELLQAVLKWLPARGLAAICSTATWFGGPVRLAALETAKNFGLRSMPERKLGEGWPCSVRRAELRLDARRAECVPRQEVEPRAHQRHTLRSVAC